MSATLFALSASPLLANDDLSAFFWAIYVLLVPLDLPQLTPAA